MGSAIGASLRAYRKRKGLTQHELAQQAGVSVRAVGYIEQGRVTRPRQATILRLAEVTGFNPAAQSPMRGARVTVGVLGPLTVLRDGRRVDVGSMRQHCVLGLLALHPNETVSLDEIIDLFWGDRPPAGHRNVVHTYIARLRRQLGAAPERGVRIMTGGGGYRLEGTADEIDLMRFDSLTAQAGQQTDRRTAQEMLSRALGCWRGPVLSDLVAALRDHPAAVAASRRRLFAAVRHADLAIDLGLYEQAVAHTQPLATLEPLHERLHAQLMIALAGSGQQAAALKLFNGLRTRLADELGVEPGEQVQAAYLRVLRQHGAIGSRR